MTTAYERALARSAGKPPAVGTGDLIHIANDNGGPKVNDTADIAVMSEIDDLFGEARNFADGEPIATQEMADSITKLYDGIHAAGKRADELRVAEKKPLDDAIDAIQAKWNVYVQPKRGRVAIAKEALGTLLTAWRTKVAREAAAEAERKRKIAEQVRADAEKAIRASAGNLAAREEAEVLVQDAKEADRWATRQERKATTGTGLRTVWVAKMVDTGAAIEWAYEKDEAAFVALVQSMADAEVRRGVRSLPGFSVVEHKVAT